MEHPVYTKTLYFKGSFDSKKVLYTTFFLISNGFWDKGIDNLMLDTLYNPSSNRGSAELDWYLNSPI